VVEFRIAGGRAWLLAVLVVLGQVAAVGTAASPAAAAPPVTALSVGAASLPAAAQDQRYRARLEASGGQRPYRWSLAGGALPSGLTLSPTGTISGAPREAGTRSLTLAVADRRGQRATATVDLTVAPASDPVQVTTSALPAGEQGIPYAATLAATGGTLPYTWAVADGTLPAGLTLAADTGRIDGVPTTAGTSRATVQVTDGLGAAASATVDVTISPARIPVQVTTSALPAGEQGTPYAATLTATGGTLPYTWAVADGTLPAGLTLGTDTGRIDGVPTTAGTSRVTVQVTDGLGATAVLALDVTVAGPPAPVEHCGVLEDSATWGRGTHQVTCPVSVPAGVELRMDAGATVLFGEAEVTVEGRLVVAGTPTSPAVLGSLEQAAYGRGLASVHVIDAGSVSVQHAVVNGSIIQSGYAPTPSGAATLTDTVLNGYAQLRQHAGSITLRRLTVRPTDHTYDSSGLSAEMTGAGSITIEDNTLSDTRTGIRATAVGAAVLVRGNRVRIHDPDFQAYDGAPLAGVGVAVVTKDAGPMPTVRGNAVENAPGEAYVLTAARLDLASVGDNTSVGSGENAMLLGGTLVADTAFPAENGLHYGVTGQSWSGPFGFLAVGPGVTLSVRAGADIPVGSRSGCGYGCFDPQLSFIHVEDGGHLVAGGSADHPVTLRVSAVDGPGQTWGGVIVDGSATFAHAVVQDTHHTSAALSAEKGFVFFRGVVRPPAGLTEEDQSAWIAVHACTPPGMKEEAEAEPEPVDCFVDVSGVDWGGGRGPGPLGSGPTVCGLALVGPWVGGDNPAAQTSALDCSSPVDPWQTIAAELQNLCSQLQDDTACVTVDGYLSCTDSITRAAIELHPQALDVLMVEKGEGYVTSFVDSVTSLYGTGLSSDPDSTPGRVVGVAQGVADAATAYLTLSSTADSCKAGFGY